MLRTTPRSNFINFTDPEHTEIDNVSTNSKPQSIPSSSENQTVVHMHLVPLNDSTTFATKQLRFTSAQEIKIGRVSGSRNQRESRTDNGVFTCEVMSREHAVLKEDGGQIMLKDLKSTHGTYINGIKLGDGSEDSDWKVLKQNDVITFGHNVRRNQNLYQHLSARVFFPKKMTNINNFNNEPISSGIKVAGISSDNVEDLGEPSKQRVKKDNTTKYRAIAESTSITKHNQEKQGTVDVGESSTSSLIDPQIKKSADKKDYCEKMIVSNVEVRERIEKVMEPSPTEESDLTKYLFESPDKPVTPAFTPDHYSVSPVTKTSTKNESTTNINKSPLDIFAQERISSQIEQDSNQMYISLGETIDSEYKNINENPDINGEGPSFLSQESKELSVTLNTSHKQSEAKEADGAAESKRRRLDAFVSATVGFVIGAAGVLIGNYMHSV
nr:15555_t:CDS:2 [Entrophospora candida]